MNNIIVADAHCDTLCLLREGADVGCAFRWEYTSGFEGYLQFLAAFADLREYHPFERAVCLIRRAKQYVEEAQGGIVLAKGDAMRMIGEKKPAALLAVENGAALEGSIEKLHLLHDMGVRSITLTWNEDNEIASGIWGRGGLSVFGRSVIREMNRLGMIVDVSHLNRQSMWDVMEWSTQAVIASHSCAFSLCAHPRNITDEQFTAMVQMGGCVGICYYPLFLNNTQNASLDDVIRHIMHFGEKGGGRGICLGSDFDGVSILPKGLENAVKNANLFDEMQKKGISGDEIRQIAAENLLGVIDGVLNY